MANRYVLGGNEEFYAIPKDQSQTFFVPAEMRLSVEDPQGVITTVSGASFVLASGIIGSTYVSQYLSYIYKPVLKGWHQYEIWVKDSTGREKVETSGFDVYDKVF